MFSFLRTCAEQKRKGGDARRRKGRACLCTRAHLEASVDATERATAAQREAQQKRDEAVWNDGADLTR
eukprot:2554020-Pleurochrysis_carterae.AAC.1